MSSLKIKSIIYFDSRRDSIAKLTNATLISCIVLDGCFIEYPCGTMRFIKNSWYVDLRV